MTWRPAATLETLRMRAALLARCRSFFAGRRVMEVETPALGRHAVTDPHLASIAATSAAAGELFLHTSPEYCMKRLLATGSPDIYQVCKVFRDGEAGRRHQPEFTMIEWYRQGFTLDGMIDDTTALLGALAETAGAPAANVRRYRYSEWFEDRTGLDPLTADIADLRACAGERAGIRELDVQLGTDRGAWLDLIMAHVLAPDMPAGELVVLSHYPACQAALARLDPRDRRVAERFEVFHGGLELANGYRELRDADEQRRRFDTDRQRRKAAGLPDIAPDERLLAALTHGLPDCCGVAVGFDRVLMSLLGIDRIEAAVSFASPA